MCSNREDNKTTLSFLLLRDTSRDRAGVWWGLFFEQEKKRGKKCTEVTSGQGKHPASAGEEDVQPSDKSSHMCRLTPRPWKMPQPSCSQAHPRTRDLSWSHSQLHKTDPTGTRGDPTERTAGNLSSGLRSSPPGQVTVPFPRRDHTSWRKMKVLRAPSRKQSVRGYPSSGQCPCDKSRVGRLAHKGRRCAQALQRSSHGVS